jgi:hypothetical protein
MNFKKPFSILLGVIASLVGVVVFVSYYSEWSSRREHAQEIEQAYTKRLLPAAEFVRAFVAREHRLPNDEEMRRAGWQIGSVGLGRDEGIAIYRQRPNWLDTWGASGKDFLLETEVPDWILYYQSWDNKRVEGNSP